MCKLQCYDEMYERQLEEELSVYNEYDENGYINMLLNLKGSDFDPLDYYGSSEALKNNWIKDGKPKIYS